MKQFYLAEIVTEDKLIHQGIFYKPTKNPSFAKASAGKAILWVHGLTSTFYGSVTLVNEFATSCDNHGIGLASFNNRGHDMITSIRKTNPRSSAGYDRVTIGAGYETFEECVYDIDAGITFLENQGFKEIILIGHSTGANKVCYYQGTKQDPRVSGVILVGPLSDRLGQALDMKKLAHDVKTMQRLVEEGKGDTLVLGYHFFPMTPRRFLSIFSSRSAEDVFDYGDQKPKLNLFSRIKKPVLLVIGEKDENLDRPIESVISVFRSHTTSTRFDSNVIPGALHSFNGKEKEVVQTIIDWVRLL